MPESESKNLHKGHRQRMMKRFMTNGINSFEEHEILEIVLFSAYSRQNTNNIAHELILKFGSLINVLNADFEQLCSVDGVGESAAAHIMFWGDLLKYCSASNYRNTKYFSTEYACDVCKDYLQYSAVEKVCVIALNNRMRFVNANCIAKGKEKSVSFSSNDIIDFALQNKCSNVIVAHSHPGSSCVPSDADIMAVKYIVDELKERNITLIDHILVSEGAVVSFKESFILPHLWA